MQNKLKGIIFDFDGTLANTLPVCIDAFHRAIEPLAGRTFSDAEIIATFGPSEEGTIKALAPDRFDEGVRSYLEHYAALHDQCRGLIPGMDELLQFLQAKKIRLALVTGKGAGSLKISFDKLGIAGYFDVIETGSVEGVVKARGIRSVLDQWAMRNEDVVYVGDAPSDILACREAGVRVVAAAWETTADADALLKLAPDEIFYSLDEFKEWLTGAL